MKTVAKWLYGCLSHMVLIVGWLWAYYIFRIKNKIEIIPITTRLKKYLFWLMNSIVVLVTGYFVYISLTAGRLYFFSGHYWDFPVLAFYKVYAVIVLVFFVTFSLILITTVTSVMLEKPLVLLTKVMMTI